MDRVVWFVFAGSRGGPTRARIMSLLLARPHNTNELARSLGLDYKTVEYNLRVLAKHRLVRQEPEGAYGAPFWPSKNLEAARADFQQIAAKMVGAAPPAPTVAPTHIGEHQP